MTKMTLPRRPHKPRPPKEPSEITKGRFQVSGDGNNISGNLKKTILYALNKQLGFSQTADLPRLKEMYEKIDDDTFMETVNIECDHAYDQLTFYWEYEYPNENYDEECILFEERMKTFKVAIREYKDFQVIYEEELARYEKEQSKELKIDRRKLYEELKKEFKGEDIDHEKVG